MEITDNRIVSASRVYCDCVLEMFWERFLIELIPSPFREIMVMLSMDWLSQFGTIIDCERHLVRVQTLGRGELIIHSKCTWGGPSICSNSSGKRYL